MIWGCPEPPPRATRTLPWVLLKHQLSRCDISKAPTVSLRSSWIWMMIKSWLSLQVNRLEHGLAGKETSCAQVGNTPGDTREDASARIVRSTSPTSPSQWDHIKPMTVLQQDNWFQVSPSPGFPPTFLCLCWRISTGTKTTQHKSYLLRNIDSCQKHCTMGRILTHQQNQPEGRIWDLPAPFMASHTPRVAPFFIVLGIHFK